MLLRQRLGFDDSVQGVLVGRVVLYGTLSLLYVGLGSACFQYYAQPQWTLAGHLRALLAQCWPWLPSLILFIPLVIYDIVRVSHQFSDPMARLRAQLVRLAAGSECSPLEFREEDCWRDLVGPVNDLQNEILALRKAVTRMAAEEQVAGQNAAAGESLERTEPILFSADVSQADRFLVGTAKSPTTVGSARDEVLDECLAEELV